MTSCLRTSVGLLLSITAVACGGDDKAGNGGKPDAAADGASGGASGAGGSGGAGGSAGGAAGDASAGGGARDASPDGAGSGGVGTDGATARDAAPESGSSASCVSDAGEDKDQDGWTVSDGDCNDCDRLINPGAIDVLHTGGGASVWGDEDCDGVAGSGVAACDTNLALADVDPADGAKAIDLCQPATVADRKWGVLSARYVRADGTVTTPGLQVGLDGAFGSYVAPQLGSRMLVLSTGHARTASEPGACATVSCNTNVAGTAPAGFPQAISNCSVSPKIADDVGLELTLRAPTNATGLSFAFSYYSFEFPEWVCTTFNDEFVAIVSPPPPGATNGNIVSDGQGYPASVDFHPIAACDPVGKSNFALHCSGVCPSVPDPYCPSGANALAGTGFDVWNAVGSAGATGWQTVRAPVTSGQTITVRFAIWDSGDQNLDSTVLIDDFRWITGEAVTVATTPR